VRKVSDCARFFPCKPYGSAGAGTMTNLTGELFK
jgi:hypothetical protein